MDPGERNRFYNLLSEIGENVIVILSTHIVEDVRELCSNMAIINQGQLLYNGTPSAATSVLEGKIWEKMISKDTLEALRLEHQVISTKLVSGQPLVHVFAEDSPGGGFERVNPNLEDVFFTQILNVHH